MNSSISDDAFVQQVADFLAPLPPLEFDGLAFDSSSTPVSQNQSEVKRSVELDKHESERANDRQRRSMYRAQRSYERDSLVQNATDLAVELNMLQRPKENTELALGSTSWKETAAQQKESRQACEVRHRQLLAQVHAHSTLIEDICHTMQQRLQQDERPVLGDDALCDAARLDKSDGDIFDAYIQGMDAMYAQTDDIFRDCSMDSVPASLLNFKQQRKRDGDREYFQFVERQLAPFTFEETCQRLWYLASMPHRKLDRAVYNGVDDTTNCFAVKYRVKRTLNTGETTSILHHTVIRRHQEIGRVAFTWRSFTEGEGQFAGMQADELGWCVVKRKREACELDTCIRNVPMHFRMATQNAGIDQFANLVLQSGAEDVFEITGSLRRLLQSYRA